ncbi:MAG TPA: DHHA1 domain-containing protein [Terriglobales bacterium]|nr:DHHA1 domain-containing protein [Terriglobales bacterium]
MSTERLYYNDSFLYDFSANVVDVKELKRDGNQSLWAVKLDQTAFYPTSGGQPFDTGRMITESKSGVPLEATVADVFEDEQGEIWHATEKVLPPGASVRGQVDTERRRDHMQQHTGQHLLSAAFISLLNGKTVSFHLGEQTSTIDLEIASLNRDDLVKVETLSNRIIAEDRPISVRYASRDEAQRMGVRKLPERTGEIRLIDIQDFDLNACGGTHARSTGQIGGLLIRKTEKVRQGMRVEFVCGQRAVRTARQDFELLASAAALYPCAPADLPGNIGKQREDARQVQKREAQLLEELAGFQAEQMLRSMQPDQAGRKVIVQQFVDRDAAFVKLLAQKLTRQSESVIALLASSQPSPTLVFARSSNLSSDLGTLLRELVTASGGRGGGGEDFAQGGVPDQARLPELLQAAQQRL